jgi:hypothetical protein
VAAAWDVCCCCSPEGHVPGVRRKEVATRAEEEFELSPEIVALLVLLGGVVAAVVFTLVIVVALDPSDANPRSGNEGEEERETEKS